MEKSHLAQALKEYDMLFSLPKLPVAILVTVIVILSHALVLSIALKINFFNSLVGVFLTFLIFEMVIKSIKETLLDVRRSLFLLNFISIFAIIIELSFVLIGLNDKLFFKVVMPIIIGFMIGFLFLAIYTTSIISRGRSILIGIASTTGLFLACIKYLLTTSMVDLALFLVSLLTVSIVFYAMTELILRAIGISIGRPGVELARAFAFAWGDHKFDYIEQLFDFLSHDERISIGLLEIKGGEKKVLAIISNVHPGPFLNIGSSNLPFILSSHIKSRTGADVIVLHGACSHGQNIPKKAYVKELGENIINTLREDFKFFSDNAIFKPVRIDSENFSFFIQRIGNKVLLIVSKKNSLFDDIDYRVGILVRELLKTYGLDGLLVDAHNSIRDIREARLLTLHDKESEEIINVVRKIKDIKWEPAHKSFFGFANVPCNEISIKDGLGPLGISCLVYSIDEEKYAWVIIDSNNLGEGLRDLIREQLLLKGFRDAEVLTTDTHYVNALGPEGAYPLLGMEKKHELLSCILSACENAIRNMEKGSVRMGINEFHVRVLGEETVENLLRAALLGSSLFRKLIEFSFLLIILLSLIMILAHL